MTTGKATFGGRIPLVNLDQGASVPFCFVFQLPDQFRPSDITDGFCQAAILDHILDLQALNAYDLVFAYDRSREFVLIVPPSVCNLLMDTSHLETGLIAVLRTLFLLGMLALRLCQLLFIFVEELGIAAGMPIRGDDHTQESQVQPN